MKKKVSKQMKGKMTIEDLSKVVTAGFANAENKTNKKVADLAEIVAKGFSGVDERMGKFEGRMDKFEHRLDGIDSKLEGLNNRIDDIALNRATRDEHRLLESRVIRLERKLAL